MNDVMEANSEFEGDVSEVEELVVYASFRETDGMRYEALGHAVLGEQPKSADEEEEDWDE